VLFLLVAVVGEDRLQLLVVGRGDALVVSVDRLQLLHQRHDRAMAVDHLRAEDLGIFVQGFAGQFLPFRDAEASDRRRPTATHP
jgi:hypothetical protein